MLQIIKYPNPILRQKCQPVERVDNEVRQLIKEMLNMMYEHNGIGLAAPQVGVAKQIIVADAGKGSIIFINPQILDYSKEKEVLSEGCLSVPGISINIRRPKEITVGGLDEKGNYREIKTHGLIARVIQHEIDHLSGRLIIDKQNFFEKILSKFRR